jgi:tricorn protease
MTHAGYLRFPHVRGDVLTFVADDDVWLAPADGGRAWRISSDHAPVSFPRLSPDGTLLAWTSWCDDTPEIRLCEVEGGNARRLTYWGDGYTRMVGWEPGGGILALTAAGQPFDRMLWAHVLALPGGAPRRLPFGPVADLALTGEATALLSGTWGRDPAYWKRYRGGTAGRLWIRGRDSEPFQRVLAGVAGQFACPMLVAGRLVFISDHEGTGNLYSCLPDGSDLRRHTDHDGFYARQASTDGQRVVYQRCGEIWLLDSLDAEPRRIGVVLTGSSSSVAPRFVSAAEHLGDLSCDESGKASVAEVQGTVHWLTHRDGPARALSVTRDARARLPRVLGTSGHAIWVTDAGGADALEVAPVAGAVDGQGPRRIAAGRVGVVAELAAAPDGKTVAAASRDGRLHLVEIATGQARELAASGDGPVTGLAFSPDSAWLAWSQPGPRPLSRIKLARVADAAIVDVTDGRFTDFEPVFSRDGRYLAFLSRRSFDPVYDAHSFDLSFPSGCRPYLVTLAAGTPSPFGPVADGRPVTDEPPDAGRRPSGDGDGESAADGGNGARESGEGEGADRQDSGPAPRVLVDTEGLPHRVAGLPVEESVYWSLYPVTGGFVWLKRPVTGVLGEGRSNPDDEPPRPALERFDLRTRSCSELVGELDWFTVSGDGNRLVVRDHGELRVVSSERKEDGDGPQPVRVDLSRARFLADPVAQWRHAFEEAGRAIRHDFWVPDMADVDWDSVLADYRPLVAAIRTPDEFADLLWEVLGELGTSHAYVRAAQADRDSPPVGHLGADLEQAGDGSWRVGRVLPGESSDPRARSPLAGPGVAVGAGAAVLAVDGQPVDPAAGPAPLLVGAAGKPVELTVATGDGQPRRVAVVPLRNERRLRYQDWVTSNRRRVREGSGDRAGYLHVPDMMGEGWAQFHRDLRAEMARDLLILDVRNNRGGHVSELVVEKLARRVIGWDLPRGMRPETYPHDAPRGPVIALTDEFAGSDGDVITAALRILGLGPVIGARTWGGVVGIDEPVELLDGTQITVPRYALWLEGHGWGVENYGVEPDIEVLITPGDWAEGRDTQLDTAVRLGLEALAARPAARPPQTADRPSRRRPLLPPRGVRQPAG